MKVCEREWVSESCKCVRLCIHVLNFVCESYNIIIYVHVTIKAIAIVELF